MAKYKIVFEPSGRMGNFLEKTSLLKCSQKLNVGLVNVCAGKGTCGKCRIKMLEGPVSPITKAEKKHLSPEELHEGLRLACRTRLLGDCQIYTPASSLSSLQRLQVEGLERAVEAEPLVRAYPVTVTPPSLKDLQPDLERLQCALEAIGLSPPFLTDEEVLRTLSPIMRENHWTFSALLRDGEVIGLQPKGSPPLGMAVDLGTTKIAAYLMDLSLGKVLATKGQMNPQVDFGGDILSRLTAASRSPEEAAEMREKTVDAINTLTAALCSEVQADRRSVAEFVIAGNTAMQHLFLGLPVDFLGKAPYVPVVKTARDLKASSLGLTGAPGAYVHVFPNIAGFVGGDHVAMLLASELYKKGGLVLALDIGTNTEICLAHDRKLTSLSCASGPAFEGAHIKQGMRVADGAIEHFQLSNSRINYQTVGGKAAVGICGSGIIEITAQLLLAGVIDSRGRMHLGPGVRETKGQREFLIASAEGPNPEVIFTQQDVREVQLAKGAIRTGIEVLLEVNKVRVEEIDQVIIAGAFGTYLDLDSAITLGLLPALPLDRFRQVGNAAGMGAKMALASRRRRLLAQEISNRVEYIELASYPGFKKIFTPAMNLEKFIP
ncbi:MAG: ASKHA domain-containing protein [Thermodesulfobacteriota bacterium]